MNVHSDTIKYTALLKQICASYVSRVKQTRELEIAAPSAIRDVLCHFNTIAARIACIKIDNDSRGLKLSEYICEKSRIKG